MTTDLSLPELFLAAAVGISLAAAVGFRVEWGSTGGLVLNLTYTKTPHGGDAVDVDQSIRLTNTQPNFGGLRRWFVCPLVVSGRACRRRIGKLYLPPGQKYFGCRRCYDLTYQSCRDSHRFDSLYADLGARLGVPGKAIEKILSGKC